MEISRTTTPITEFDLTPFPTMGIPIVIPRTPPSTEDLTQFIASVKIYIKAHDFAVLNERLPITTLNFFKKAINHLSHTFRDDVLATAALESTRKDMHTKADALAQQIISSLPHREGEFLPIFEARSQLYLHNYRELSKLITDPAVKHYVTETLHPRFLTHMIHSLSSDGSLTPALTSLQTTLQEYIYNFSDSMTLTPLIPSWSKARLTKEITYQISPAFREADHKGHKWAQQFDFLSTLPVTDATFRPHLDLLYRIQNLFTTSTAALPREMLPQKTELIKQIFHSTNLRDTVATLTTDLEALSAAQTAITGRSLSPLEGDLGQLTEITYKIALASHKKNTLETLTRD